jgi:hypothetical protein
MFGKTVAKVKSRTHSRLAMTDRNNACKPESVRGDAADFRANRSGFGPLREGRLRHFFKTAI